VYARPLHEGRPLTFGVSGMLWRASLLMFDRETGGLWSHVTGNAVSGPLAGARLQMLHAIHTTWGLWSANYPETLALAKRRRLGGIRPHRFEGEFALGVVVDGQAVGFPFAELERAPLAHATVAGQPLLIIHIAEAATAVGFHRRLGDRLLTFRDLAAEGAGWRMQDQETGTLWNAVTGEALSGPLAPAELRPVPATQAFLGSWRQLYPGGRIWRAQP
jgi:hypothetical protein